jgi:hypothetical protein
VRPTSRRRSRRWMSSQGRPHRAPGP